MKTLLALTIAVMLVVASAGIVQAEQWNASKVCKFWEDFFFDTHGDCVSFWEANNGPVLFCKAWQEFFPDWFEAWFKNLGECISNIRAEKY